MNFLVKISHNHSGFTQEEFHNLSNLANYVSTSLFSSMKERRRKRKEKLGTFWDTGKANPQLRTSRGKGFESS